MGSYAREIANYMKRAKHLTDSQKILRYIAMHGCVAKPRLVRYVAIYLSHRGYPYSFLEAWLRIHLGIVKIDTRDNIQYICLNTEDLGEGEK